MSDTYVAEESPSRPVPRQGDLTQGPILRTLIIFAIPTMLSNVLQTLGQTINTIWVGQLLGEGALAATVNANLVMFLVFSTVFGFGMAATVKVGHGLGAGNVDAARRAFGTGTGFCVGAATLGAVLGWIFADPLLYVLATPETIHDQALAYLRVIFIGMPISTLQMMISMGLRGAGDAKSPFYAVIVITILTIVLNPLLILGIGPFPELGIAGSALANVLANVGGFLLLTTWVYWRDLPLRLKGREFRYLIPQGEDLSYVVAKGVPMGAQTLLNSAAGLIMLGFVNREGMLTTAAYGAVMQVWSYVQMPAFAVSMAVSAMVAQNAGAAQHERSGRITMAGVGTTAVITVVMALLLLAFDTPLLSLFLGSGSDAVPIANRIQLIAIWSWVLNGVMMTLMGTMRAYGAVVGPLIIMAVALYPGRLGFYHLTYGALGADALWLSFVFGSAIALLMTFVVYNRGGWRRSFSTPAPMPAAAE
ncbi:MAG: MATE family efflux transporter [Novosphingobium sp.]|nr:MATE family efflux transporter [Novosphingobium sp.]MCP5404591.1 MATE family efflux transporter [Novosphingobium sp.]